LRQSQCRCKHKADEQAREGDLQRRPHADMVMLTDSVPLLAANHVSSAHVHALCLGMREEHMHSSLCQKEHNTRRAKAAAEHSLCFPPRARSCPWGRLFVYVFASTCVCSRHCRRLSALARGQANEVPPEAENRPQAAVLACRSASRRAPQLQVTHLIGFVTPHGLARVLRPCWCALVASVGKGECVRSESRSPRTVIPVLFSHIHRRSTA
jgi:hypothetical protein